MSASAVAPVMAPASTGDPPADLAGINPALPAPKPAAEPVEPTPITGTVPAITPASAGQAPVIRLDEPEHWKGIPVPAGYSLDGTGVSTTNNSRISGPLWVAATTFDAIAKDHGYVIRWHDVYGQLCELAITRDELHSYTGTLPARLARAGLRISPGDERKVLKYLAEFDAGDVPRWNSVSRVGWIDDPDGSLAYMLPPPTGLIALGNRVPVVFQPERESPSTASLRSRATLEDWNRQVVDLCADNPLLLFAILAGLAAPLLRFAELEGGGFHYYGRSSHGKTTAAQVAASVWGNGADPAEAPDRALVQKWNATHNAFEALLSAHNDGLLVLDEIHTCDAKDFGAVLYNMSGGVGKQAMDRERNLRRARRWRALYVSTGEVSVFQKLLEGGKTPHAGQQLRLLDLPIEAGIIVKTGNLLPATFADRLKKACGRYYGTAGPALVHQLVSEYENAGQLAGTIRAMLEHQCKRLTPSSTPPEHARAIKRFALLAVAGEIAIKLGVLECSVEQVNAAVRAAIRAWQSDGMNVPDRLRGVLNVQAFLERSEARFQDLGAASGSIPLNRAGFVGIDSRTAVPCFYFTGDGFREACGGQDARETARELDRLGYLFARERGHLNEKRTLEIGRGRVYVVMRSLLEFDPTTTSERDNGTSGTPGPIELIHRVAPSAYAPKVPQ